MIISLIMGRKGSKGLPGKNLHQIQGKPLAYYPMNAAQICPEVDGSFISTDDEQIMDLVRSFDIDVTIRPSELCTDNALGEDVYVHALKYIQHYHYDWDVEMLGNFNNLNCDRDSQGDVWFADMGVSVVRTRCIENIHEGLLPLKTA